MLQNWFILMPEICLLSFFIIALPVELYRAEKTSKTFYSIAQLCLLASLSTSVILYNKSAFPLFWQNTPFTTLFKTFAYLLSWAWFYLSSKWFLTKNRPSFKFYSICFSLLFCFNILASSSSLLTLGIIVPVISFFLYLLILRHWDIERVQSVASIYGKCAVFFVLLLWGGILILYHYSGSFEYSAIKQFLSIPKSSSVWVLIGAIGILSCFMFMMSLVPFHNWFISFISNGVLPVCGFITLVPPLIYLCTLIRLITECFSPIIEFIVPILGIFACLSLIIGALSANCENNIRRMFGYLSIYCNGFTLICMLSFSDDAIIASFAYTVISILSFAGAYTIFLGLKSRGDYLSDISALSGFYNMRPYMSAALLVFMFSLIGLAPTLGFFGYLSVFNNLISNGDWWWIAVLMLGLLFVTGSCLQIVRIIYFEASSTKFDRTDKAIYICLFINMIFILLSLINPGWLLSDALIILGGIS